MFDETGSHFKDASGFKRIDKFFRGKLWNLCNVLRDDEIPKDYRWGKNFKARNAIQIFIGMVTITKVPPPSRGRIVIFPPHIIFSRCRMFAKAVCGS